MKKWYHKLHSDEITKSSHQKSPKIAKIAMWRNFEKVNFGKNAAKSSLMIFHTTFVRKKSEMFMQMSISMSTPFLPHCANSDDNQYRDDNDAIQDVAKRLPMLDEAIQDEAMRSPMPE